MLALASTLSLTLAFVLANASGGSLVSCLTNNGLRIEVSQNSTWHASTTPFNTRFHFSPSALVYPTQTSDVSKAIQCAVNFGVRVSPLSGGHSYSASGYGSQDGTLVISFRDMAHISYQSSEETVTIQPGARLGDVALELHDKYGRALAHGVCPYVGIGGHAAFGGWGFSSRNWGLLIDQVEAAELVLANGTVVHLSNTQNPDLFWAIRGAASSFGIVTEYTLKTHPVPLSVIRYSYTFSNPDLSADRFAKLLGSYQTWGRTAPKELGIEANVWQGGKVEIGGYYMGSLFDFNRLAGSLLRTTGLPNATYVQERSWLVALTEVNGGSPLSTKGKSDAHDTFFAKSLVVPTASPLTATALSALATYFANTKIPNTLSWFIQFELWGGGNSAISSLPSDATAYPHRAHLWTIQFYARSSTAWPTEGTVFVNGMVSSITDHMKGTTFGAYANYLDPLLKGWHDKYYAGNYPRLAALQKQVDPHGVFQKAQNIGAPDF
ncbi:FAD-binding domain-containing protein [Mycena venus]|uniref:FAD-binding domain-containing protein n=1 Tax=Mycena venus TaxID=2733690 RepID=A0A8H7D3U5_9AGAR|nr:FAD-binding domain-containing protein [Mycena venus]